MKPNTTPKQTLSASEVKAAQERAKELENTIRQAVRTCDRSNRKDVQRVVDLTSDLSALLRNVPEAVCSNVRRVAAE